MFPQYYEGDTVNEASLMIEPLRLQPRIVSTFIEVIDREKALLLLI
jgi:hypothetical protein